MESLHFTVTLGQIASWAQILLLPAIAYLVSTLGKITGRMDSMEKEQIKFKSVLEALEKQTLKENDRLYEVLNKLDATISKLAERVRILEIEEKH